MKIRFQIGILMYCTWPIVLIDQHALRARPLSQSGKASQASHVRYKLYKFMLNLSRNSLDT